MYYNKLVTYPTQPTMRQIFSLSLPAGNVRQIKYLAKKRGFSSVSAYVHSLLQADEQLISETELLEFAREARQEYRRGQSIQGSSIADLI